MECIDTIILESLSVYLLVCLCLCTHQLKTTQPIWMGFSQKPTVWISSQSVHSIKSYVFLNSTSSKYVQCTYRHASATVL